MSLFFFKFLYVGDFPLYYIEVKEKLEYFPANIYLFKIK